jgi:glycosyltransferase involved in cell wall biosynthesis
VSVKVLLDATAVPADRGGVGRYIDNVIPALVRAGVELEVVCKADDVERIGSLTGERPVIAPASTRYVARRLIWEQVGLPWLVKRSTAEVVHAPHYTQPLAIRRPLVVTLHDATFFTDATLHSSVKGPFFRAATKLALRHAACCIVPSQATADELARVAGADPDRLHVAHHGVDHDLFAPPSKEQVTAIRQRLGLPRDLPYVGFLGTLEPRKNVPALIRGWIRACEHRADPPALVVAGAAGWDAAIDTAVAEVPSGLRLLRPGFLPLEELPGFLGGALLVTYPSLGEGFGLPVLEAMACGAAVLTTKRLALPEVGGDAVAYAEPDEISIARALTDLLDEPVRRATLAAAGRRRAATFTWDRCANAHIVAYARASAQGYRSWRARPSPTAKGAPRG